MLAGVVYALRAAETPCKVLIHKPVVAMKALWSRNDTLWNALDALMRNRDCHTLATPPIDARSLNGDSHLDAARCTYELQRWAATRCAALTALPRQLLDETFLRRHELAMALVSHERCSGSKEGAGSTQWRPLFAVQPGEAFEPWVKRLCSELPRLQKRARAVVRLDSRGAPRLWVPRAEGVGPGATPAGCPVTRRLAYEAGMSYAEYAACVGVQVLLATRAGRTLRSQRRRNGSAGVDAVGTSGREGDGSAAGGEQGGSVGVSQHAVPVIRSLRRATLVEHMLAMELHSMAPAIVGQTVGPEVVEGALAGVMLVGGVMPTDASYRQCLAIAIAKQVASDRVRCCVV